MGIKTFKNEATEAIFNGIAPKGFPVAVVKVGRRKLNMIEAAKRLDDLKVPPGNQLHPLLKDRAGQHAIWINDQYRICFRWTDEGAEDVEVTNYH